LAANIVGSFVRDIWGSPEDRRRTPQNAAAMVRLAGVSTYG
jgi:hypothetical protein